MENSFFFFKDISHEMNSFILKLASFLTSIFLSDLCKVVFLWFQMEQLLFVVIDLWTMKDILSVLKVLPRSLPDLSVHVDFSFFGMSQNLKCIIFSSEEF